MIISIERLQFPELLACLREQADDAFPSLKDKQRVNLLADKWHQNAEFCTCRDDRGQLVGMIAFYANRPEGGEVYIPHVYVCREHRGKGVFSELFHAVLKYVTCKGFEAIRLEVQNNNLTAKKAYLRQGFHIEGSSSDNSVFMKCRINNAEESHAVGTVNQPRGLCHDGM